MHCPKCQSSSLVKTGRHPDNKQRYQCKNCNLHFKQGDTHSKERKKTSQRLSSPISFRCSKEEKARIKEAAKKLNLSVNAYICYKLDEFLKKNGDDRQMYLGE